MNETGNTDKAIEIVAYYTLAAGATGAVPVPAASAAIIAENGLMLAHISSVLGHQIKTSDIVGALGIAGTLNIAGRQVFIEGAKNYKSFVANWKNKKLRPPEGEKIWFAFYDSWRKEGCLK